MKYNLLVDSCTDFSKETEDIPRVPFRILIENEEIIDENLDIDEIMAKFDKESSYRRLSGIQNKIVFVLAIAFASFQLYTAIFGILPAQIQRSVHLAFVFALV